MWRVAQPLWSAAWVFMAVDHFSGVEIWNHAACTGKHQDECSVDDAVNDKKSLCCSVCNLKQWIFSFKCTLQAYKICFQIASASTKWRYDQWNRERFLHKQFFFNGCRNIRLWFFKTIPYSYILFHRLMYRFNFSLKFFENKLVPLCKYKIKHDRVCPEVFQEYAFTESMTHFFFKSWSIKFLETYSIFAQCNFFICSHIFACNNKKRLNFT